MLNTHQFGASRHSVRCNRSIPWGEASWRFAIASCTKHATTIRMLRTVRISLRDDSDVRATVHAFRSASAAISAAAFNDGKPLSAVALQRNVYEVVKLHINSAQMACSVLRRVAAAYESAKSNKHPVAKPFAFARPLALWLIGERGRDARVCPDGTLSIWTINGRKRLRFTVPEPLQADFRAAIEFKALQVVIREGRLVATLSITLPDVAGAGATPIGVDLNETNAVVAVDAAERILFVSGRSKKIHDARTRKTRKRLQKKLAILKAQKRSTKSVGRVLKRLGRKQSRRTIDLARCTAKLLCEWAPSDAVIALEDLSPPKATKKQIAGTSEKRTALRRRLSSFAYSTFRIAILSRAERTGKAVVFVNPAFTSQRCSQCKQIGTRTRHQFSCDGCGHVDHADINAARNIRDLYCASRRSGLPVNQPPKPLREASPGYNPGSLTDPSRSAPLL